MATDSTTGFVSPMTAVLVPLPFLEQGDCLTSAEFERRYEAMPGLKKAELIEGVVHMPSPVRMDSHGAPHADLLTWLGTYRAATPGVYAGDNTTLKLDDDNVPQPDGLLMIDSKLGGQATIDAQGYINGAPELVAEIASSSATIDLHAKLNVYCRSGVREYIVWRTFDRSVDWFELRDSNYAPLSTPEDGILRSRVFPGLWLDAQALVRQTSFDGVLSTLQMGLKSSEHEEFVTRLNSGSATSR